MKLCATCPPSSGGTGGRLKKDSTKLVSTADAKLVQRDRDQQHEHVDQDPANFFGCELHAARLGRSTMYGRKRDCNPSKLASCSGAPTIGAWLAGSPLMKRSICSSLTSRSSAG